MCVLLKGPGNTFSFDRSKVEDRREAENVNPNGSH
jgi:hypothetical protein